MICSCRYIGVPRVVSVKGVLCIDFMVVATNEVSY
jgi:hypothetical protein